MERVLLAVGSVLRGGARRRPYLGDDEWGHREIDFKDAAPPTEISNVSLKSQP